MSETIKLKNAQPGDVIHVGGNDFPVVDGTSSTWIYVRIWGDDYAFPISVLKAFGATVTRPAPARPLPNWKGAVIESASGACLATRIEQDGEWVSKTGAAWNDFGALAYVGPNWRLVSRPITDDMVERAARAMCANSNDVPWDEEQDRTTKGFYLGDARAALEAALGGEQA